MNKHAGSSLYSGVCIFGSLGRSTLRLCPNPLDIAGPPILLVERLTKSLNSLAPTSVNCLVVLLLLGAYISYAAVVACAAFPCAGSRDSTFAAHHPDMMAQYPCWYRDSLEVECEPGMSLMDYATADLIMELVPKAGAQTTRDILKELKAKRFYR